MSRKLAIHPLARDDLFDLYSYIEDRSGPARAGGYIARIETLCGHLASLPDRGTDRSDLGAGIRTVALERRTLIVYRTLTDEVEILRVLYGGRDFSADDVPL